MWLIVNTIVYVFYVSMALGVSFGLGWVIDRLTALSMFEATLVSTIVTIGVLLLLSVNNMCLNVLEIHELLEKYGNRTHEEEQDEDWDEHDADGNVEVTIPSLDVNRQERRMMANESCWCGSGKKLKNCHGTRNR